MTLHATPPGVNREIDALRRENAALKAELAARPNYGTASNHSVWALQRNRIRELEARVAAHHSGNTRNPCPVCGAKKEAP
jgi:hypothetical protein